MNDADAPNATTTDETPTATDLNPGQHSVKHRALGLPKFGRRSTIIAVAAVLILIGVGVITIPPLRETFEDATGIDLNGDDNTDNAKNKDRDGDGIDDSKQDLPGTIGALLGNHTVRTESVENKEARETANKERTDLVEKAVVPTKGNHSTLLTPASKGWWEVATSTAPDLFLYEIEAPTDANWVSVSSSEAFKPANPSLHAYQAVHIGFSDGKALRKFASTTYAGDHNDARSVMIRGNVLTFAPTWVDTTIEPYPTAKELAVLDDLKPTAGSWRVNIGDYINVLTEGASQEDREAVTAAASALGFTPDTVWSATATAPTGPWVGTLTGYQTDQISITDVPKAFATTVDVYCPTSDQCFEDDINPITAIPANLFLVTKENSLGQTDAYLPEGVSATPKDNPTELDLAGGINFGTIQGLINGTFATPNPPVGLIKFIVSGNKMTVYTPLGTPPTPADTPEQPLDEPINEPTTPSPSAPGTSSPATE